uniref:Uncharacterized protein n=1 Tax=Meloidogyne hapla TaxID=6305 RepID=A0A1I8BUA3_MELHA
MNKRVQSNHYTVTFPFSHFSLLNFLILKIASTSGVQNQHNYSTYNPQQIPQHQHSSPVSFQMQGISGLVVPQQPSTMQSNERQIYGQQTNSNEQQQIDLNMDVNSPKDKSMSRNHEKCLESSSRKIQDLLRSLEETSG